MKHGEWRRNRRPGKDMPSDPVRLLHVLLTSAPQPFGNDFLPHSWRDQNLIEQSAKEIQSANAREKDEWATVANRRQQMPMVARIAARSECPGRLLRG